MDLTRLVHPADENRNADKQKLETTLNRNLTLMKFWAYNNLNLGTKKRVSVQRILE